VDLGFGNAEALGFQVTLPMERYQGPEQVMQFYREATERLRAVPGVRQVGATGVLPGDRSSGVGLRLTPPGLPDAEAQDYPFASMLFGSPDYFGAVGIPILRGRSFLPGDAVGAPRVTILSESAARSLWPDGREPVGQLVEISGSSSRQLEVVGVVADVLMRGPEAAPGRGQFYQPMLQATPFGSMAFVVDAGVPLAGLAEPLRLALAEVDPSLPPYSVRPVHEISSGFLSTHRLATTLMGGFAVMTLLLASVALYGVLAQLVTQRTRELGIRIALGADGGRLLRGVVGEGLRLALVGIVVGGAAAGVAARLIAAFVPALDSPSWPAIAVDGGILLAVAALASWIPARRAALTDPLVALRQE
jgi:putative ABC transport system permease protein